MKHNPPLSEDEITNADVPTMLRFILKWLKCDLANVALVVGAASAATVGTWLEGTAAPSVPELRSLQDLFNNAWGVATRTMLKSLTRWGCTQLRIAQETKCDAACISNWIAGVTRPNKDHFRALVRFYDSARRTLLRDFLAELFPNMRFQCSHPGPKGRKAAHTKNAYRTLKRLQEMPLTAGALKAVILISAVPFDDDAWAHIFEILEDQTQIFTVIVNEGCGPTEQKDALCTEWSSHIVDKVLKRKLGC